MNTMMQEMGRDEPNRTVINQYHRVWQRKSIFFRHLFHQIFLEATQLGAKEHQNAKNDDLVVSQKALLDTFGEISRTSINDFRYKSPFFSKTTVLSTLQNDCFGGNSRWDYHNAFFFAGTLVSTIGYGNTSPATNNGKLFCIVFVSFGVPYFGKGHIKMLKKLEVPVLTLKSLSSFCHLRNHQRMSSNVPQQARACRSNQRGLLEKRAYIFRRLAVLHPYWLCAHICASLHCFCQNRAVDDPRRCLFFNNNSYNCWLWRLYSLCSAT